MLIDLAWVSRVVTIVLAFAAVERSPVIAVTLADRSWLATLSVAAAVSVDCRAATLPPEAFSRLLPLNSEESMIVVICSLSASKSFAMAARLSVSRPASDASVALVFIWFTRSETCSAPATATSTVLLARPSDELTAFRPPISPRSVWAIVKDAESSLVEATARPVLMRLWTVPRPLLVALRLWRAAIAPVLVFTEKDIVHFLLWIKAGSAALARVRWPRRPNLSSGRRYILGWALLTRRYSRVFFTVYGR